MVKEAKTETGSDPNVESLVKQALADFETALDNDLNTSRALAAIHNLVREVNAVLSDGALKDEDQKAVLDAVEKFDFVLGIFGEENQEILNEEIETLIAKRREARNNRDFQRSDEIRDLLAEKGITLEDTKEGVRWKRK